MAKTYTKRLGILRKKEGMSHEQFVNHWLKTHAVLCTKLPKLRRYSVNLVDRQRFPKFGYDGFSELWFDSEEDLVAALSSPEGKTRRRKRSRRGLAPTQRRSSAMSRTAPTCAQR